MTADIKTSVEVVENEVEKFSNKLDQRNKEIENLKKKNIYLENQTRSFGIGLIRKIGFPQREQWKWRRGNYQINHLSKTPRTEEIVYRLKGSVE